MDPIQTMKNNLIPAIIIIFILITNHVYSENQIHQNVPGQSMDLNLKQNYYAVNTPGINSSRPAAASREIKDIIFNISLNGIAAFPLDELMQLYSPGYGLLFNISFSSRHHPNFSIGVQVSYILFQSSSEFISKMYMIPTVLAANYQFMLPGKFSISPKIAIGTNYRQIIADKSLLSSFGLNYAASDYYFGLILTGGIILKFHIKEFISIKLDIEYSAIFEESEVLDLISMNAGVCFRF